MERTKLNEIQDRIDKVCDRPRRTNTITDLNNLVERVIETEPEDEQARR